MSIRELDLLRRTTYTLIASRPTSIQLERPQPLVSDGIGGFVEAPGGATVMQPAERYFVATADFATLIGAQEEKGEAFIMSHLLIGPWDDDMEVRDFFFHNDVKYVVAAIDADRTYQVKARVGTARKVFIP